MKKDIVLFSHDDLDGVTPRFISKALLGDQLVYSRLCGYNNINEEILEFVNSDKHSLDQVIFITDIGINKEVADKLESLHSQGQTIRLLDHHVTNLDLNRFEWAFVAPELNGVKESGTSLFYDYLVNNGYAEENSYLKSFAEVVRKYDTWDWYEENYLLAHDLNMLLFLIGEDEMEKFVLRDSKKLAVFDSIPDDFSLLLEVEKRKIDRFCRSKMKTIRWREISGRKTAIVYLDQYQPYVADAIQDNFPDTDAICMVDVGRSKVSLRSRKDEVDIVDIAQYFGGGGHPKAAGFQIPIDFFEEFVFHPEQEVSTLTLEE